MFRRFISDKRGNYMVMTAIAIVPIMGALAVGVDYTEMSRQRQAALNALDAANVATARRLIEGADAEELVSYANQFFIANLGGVDPDNATLTVKLPREDEAGGKITLSADLKYKPYFMPFLSGKVSLDAESELQLKNTLEIALVLDNSGSMDHVGSGSGKKRMELLKQAASELVDTLSQQGQMIKQLDKAVQFAVVPFAASVNVGPQNATASWMDTEGRSPIHHENFDWGSMTGDTKVELVGGSYYKKGKGWGDEEGDIVTRFTMFDELQRITGKKWVNTGTQTVCTKKKWNGKCSKWEKVSSGYWETTYASYASWAGCVEARPSPYNRTDHVPTYGNPATLYVPMFAPDESDGSGWGWGSYGNYWDDLTNSSNHKKRQRHMPKYFEATEKPAAKGDEGPNASCTTNPITPLTDVTKQQGLNKIKSAITAMKPLGGTNVPEGMAWGWRTVSGGEPFSEGRPDNHKGNDKVVIVLTDGENTYYTPTSLGYSDFADNKSTYSAYGYTGANQPGESVARLFMETSGNVKNNEYSNANYSKALDEHLAATCTNAKQAGVLIMTVALDLSSNNAAQKAQIEGLSDCASESRFRRDSDGKPRKLFWNSKGGDLSKTFKEIADELSNLRFVG